MKSTVMIAGLILLLLVSSLSTASARPLDVKTCQQVSASDYNAGLRVRRSITGNDQDWRRRPVCVSAKVRLKKSIRRQRAKCVKGAIVSGASWYGGPQDSMTKGTSGKYGDLANAPWSFAELGMGSAMGGLAPRSWWYVNHAGRTKRAQKLDIGKGGGEIDGVTRGFDAWHVLADYLRLKGNGVVKLAKHNCWAVWR
jgi:hypothetical protein